MVVVHHDHIEDYITHLLRACTNQATLWDHSALTSFTMAHRRFDPTPICEICNSLDGSNLKAVRKADRWFSFTPFEMKEITGASDGHHRSLRDAAGRLWDEARRDHRGRLSNVRLDLPATLGLLAAGNNRPTNVTDGTVPGLGLRSSALHSFGRGIPIPLYTDFASAAGAMRYRELMRFVRRAGNELLRSPLRS